MNSEPIHVNDDAFEQTVMQAELPVIVDFWAPWCGPCKMVAPILDKLAKEYEGKAVIAKVNTDENPEWAQKFGVQGIPTMLFVSEGNGTADARPGERRVYRGVPEAAGDGEGGGSYRRLASEGRHSGDIRTGHVATARKTESDEVRVRVRVGGGRLGRKSGTGQIDKQSVASVFRRRKRAIRRCYERSLRSSPGAEGKVTIQFTIGPAGRITNILVTEDTTGVSSIASCIVGRVRGWRFDPPDRGSVTFSKAFILSKG